MTDENRIKFELKEDKIIDILLHSATREDINKLDAKIDSSVAKLDARIDKLETRIDKLETRIDKLDAKIDRLLWFIIAGILIPILMHIFKL